MRHSSSHRPRAGFAVLGFVAAGCGGGSVTAGLDSPDIPISPPVETVYTVGVLDGASWEMFGRVTAVAFDADGTLFILDSDAGHVVVVDPVGEFVRTISNKGEGPGELNQPTGMVVLDDGRIGVHDFGKGIQVFSRDGELLQEASFGIESEMPGLRIHALPDHSLLSPEVGLLRMRSPTQEPGETEGRPIGRFRLDGTRDLFHTAWAGPPPDDTEMASGDMRIVMSSMGAFPLPLGIGVLGDGRVAVADSVGYRIKLLDPAGNVAGTLERPVAPVPVTEEIREAERERRLAEIESGGGGGGTGVAMISISGSIRGGASQGGVSRNQDAMEAMRKMREDQIRDMRFPEEIPVITNLAVDWSDRIWVERSALPGETGPTDILAAAGQYFGTIAPDGLRIPAAFGPGGLLAYVDRDELEIQRVRVLRIVGDRVLESADPR